MYDPNTFSSQIHDILVSNFDLSLKIVAGSHWSLNIIDKISLISKMIRYNQSLQQASLIF
jgi:hypothetical protein